ACIKISHPFVDHHDLCAAQDMACGIEIDIDSIDLEKFRKAFDMIRIQGLFGIAVLHNGGCSRSTIDISMARRSMVPMGMGYDGMFDRIERVYIEIPIGTVISFISFN